jgi:hypothetical protein
MREIIDWCTTARSGRYKIVIDEVHMPRTALNAP